MSKKNKKIDWSAIARKAWATKRAKAAAAENTYTNGNPIPKTAGWHQAAKARQKEQEKLAGLRGELNRMSNHDLKRAIEKAGQAGSKTPKVKVAKEVLKARAENIAKAQAARQAKLKDRQATAAQTTIMAAAQTLSSDPTHVRLMDEATLRSSFGLTHTTEAIQATEALLKSDVISASVRGELERELTHLRGMHKAYKHVADELDRFRQ